jgi:hypothetical protein
MGMQLFRRSARNLAHGFVRLAAIVPPQSQKMAFILFVRIVTENKARSKWRKGRRSDSMGVVGDQKPPSRQGQRISILGHLQMSARGSQSKVVRRRVD